MSLESSASVSTGTALKDGASSAPVQSDLTVEAFAGRELFDGYGLSSLADAFQDLRGTVDRYSEDKDQLKAVCLDLATNIAFSHQLAAEPERLSKKIETTSGDLRHRNKEFCSAVEKLHAHLDTIIEHFDSAIVALSGRRKYAAYARDLLEDITELAFPLDRTGPETLDTRAQALRSLLSRASLELGFGRTPQEHASEKKGFGVVRAFSDKMRHPSFFMPRAFKREMQLTFLGLQELNCMMGELSFVESGIAQCIANIEKLTEEKASIPRRLEGVHEHYEQLRSREAEFEECVEADEAAIRPALGRLQREIECYFSPEKIEHEGTQHAVEVLGLRLSAMRVRLGEWPEFQELLSGFSRATGVEPEGIINSFVRPSRVEAPSYFPKDARLPSGEVRDKQERFKAVNIRWASSRDRVKMAGIEKLSFEYPWSEEDFERCAGERSVVPMAAVDPKSGEVMGFMIYELHDTKLHVLNFAVHPDYRRSGIGEQMVERLTSKLSEQRRNRVMLEIRDGNLAGQLFFRKCGFRAVGVRRDFYEDSTDDAYLMELRFDPRIHALPKRPQLAKAA